MTLKVSIKVASVTELLLKIILGKGGRHKEATTRHPGVMPSLRADAISAPCLSQGKLISSQIFYKVPSVSSR